MAKEHVQRMSAYVKKLLDEKRIVVNRDDPYQAAQALYCLGAPHPVASDVFGLNDFYPTFPIDRRSMGFLNGNRRALILQYAKETGNKDDIELLVAEKTTSAKEYSKSLIPKASRKPRDNIPVNVESQATSPAPESKPIEDIISMRRELEESVKTPRTEPIPNRPYHTSSVPQFGLYGGGISSSVTGRKLPKRF